jgi:hypothetical protein
MVAMTDDPLHAIKERLWNWGRWTRVDAIPRLEIPEPPCFSHWIPRDCWDHGLQDGAPEESRASLREKDAEALDHTILLLARYYRNTIKRHFSMRWEQPRDIVDQSCRALKDRL